MSASTGVCRNQLFELQCMVLPVLFQHLLYRATELFNYSDIIKHTCYCN